MSAVTPSTVLITKELLANILEINSLSRLPEVITPFYFSDWPSLNSMNIFPTARIQKYFNDPNAELLKIVDMELSEIRGFACLLYPDGLVQIN
jgi:hypothetical protein